MNAMIRDVVIFGIGDIARLCYHYFSDSPEHRVVAFTVDAAHRTQETLFSLPVVNFENLNDQFPPSTCEAFVSLSYSGLNDNRAKATGRLRDAGYTLASIVTRTAVANGCKIGQNVLIMEHACVQPGCELGDDVVVGPHAIVCHDTVIEDHVYISPAACFCGHNVIGAFSVIGTGAVIAPHVRIGRRNFIGFGARIVSNTADDTSYLEPTTPLSGVSSKMAARIESLKQK